MGDSLKREFSLEPVDTGRVQGGTPTGATPTFMPGGTIPGAGGGGIMGMGMPGGLTPGAPAGGGPGGAAPDPTGTGGPFAPGSIQAGVLSRATGGMVPDPATQQGGQPITRPSFLQAFLSNLGPALAGGLAAQPGKPFGSGFSGALAGMEEQNRYQTQLQQQQQQYQLQQETMRRQIAASQSSQDLQAAETARINKLLPGEVEAQQATMEQRKAMLAMASDPTALDALLKPAIDNLGPTTSDEKALIAGAKTDVIAGLKQGKFDPKPMQDAAEKIVSERATTQRSLVGSAYKGWEKAFIRENNREPTAKEIQDFQNAPQQFRLAGMLESKQENYIDTSIKGGEVATMTAGDFSKANKDEPGRFVKYTPTVATAIKAQSLINDIRDGMTAMQKAIDDPKFDFTSKGRALMAAANDHAENALSVVKAGLAGSGLSDQEQNYVVAYASLLERIMSMRGLQSQGAGSESQRLAMASLAPGLATADKGMAAKLMKSLKNNVDNVASSIPKIGKGMGGVAAGKLPAIKLKLSSGTEIEIPGTK